MSGGRVRADIRITGLASFVERDDILKLVEGMLAAVFKTTRGVDVPLPFPRMTYHEAMNRYGSDKPDTRFGVELVDLSDVFAQSQFKVFAGALSSGGVVKAINAKGWMVWPALAWIRG